MSTDAIAYAKAVDLGEAECAAARLLLYVIAENTFNDTFVCRICQEQLAYEAGRIEPRTVRRHLKALEEARIIIRASRRSAAGHINTDAIRIRGYKKWYLAGHHAVARRRRAAASPPDKMSAGAGGGPVATSGQNVRKPADTCCPQASGHLVSGTIESRTSIPVLSPPNPRKRGQVRVEKLSKELGWLEALALDEPGPVVTRFLDPVLRQRALNIAVTPDPMAALRAVRDRWRGEPAEVMAAAAEILLAERAARFKPADLDTAVRRAQAKVKAHAALARGQAERRPQEPEFYGRGSVVFAAWLAPRNGARDKLGKPYADYEGVRLKPDDAERLRRDAGL